MAVPASTSARRRLRLAGLLLTSIIAAPAYAQSIPLDVGKLPSEDVISLAQGGVEKAVAALPAIMEDLLGRSGLPGAAVAVVHNGKTVFAQGYGLRESGKPDKVDTKTVFQIASLSKPIAATIAATQVTAGRVGWNDRVIQHLSSFALQDAYVTANCTIGDLYAHRSGLPQAAGDDLEDLGFDRATILKRLRLLSLDQFRTSYNYANFGITAGAEAVAAASGLTWEDLAQKALYEPLGMTATSSRYADFLARENRATLHSLENGHFEARYRRDADQQSPAGGVSSNVLDLAEWLKLILANGRYNGRELIAAAALQPAMRAQAFSAPAQTIASRSGFYGFGFNVSINANGRPDLSHSGAFVTGAGTNVQILPSANLAIVVLTNGAPKGVAESITATFFDIAQFGVPTRDWYALINPILNEMSKPVGDLVAKTPPATPAPAAPLDNYVGTYESPYFGPAHISKTRNGLVLTLGPSRIEMPMVHWDGNTFAVSPRSENAPFGSHSSVQFTMSDGKAKSLAINYLNNEGMAHWTR